MWFFFLNDLTIKTELKTKCQQIYRLKHPTKLCYSGGNLLHSLLSRKEKTPISRKSKVVPLETCFPHHVEKGTSLPLGLSAVIFLHVAFSVQGCFYSSTHFQHVLRAEEKVSIWAFSCEPPSVASQSPPARLYFHALVRPSGFSPPRWFSVPVCTQALWKLASSGRGDTTQPNINGHDLPTSDL